MRVATLDVGTNSVLLLVAEGDENGRPRALLERMEITRLGRGVDRTGVLDGAALGDTLDAIRRFADEARSLGAVRIAATATSAARDARNGSRLVDGAAALGVPVEIISGDREAQLAWRAAAADFLPHGNAPLGVADIGGGSTELVVGDRDGVRFRRSFDVGSVRLTERYVRGDPPEPDALRRLDEALANALADVPKLPAGSRVVGIAGTFTTLAAIALGLRDYDSRRVHGLELTQPELDRIADELAASTLERRLAMPGLHPKRADVIVAGARLAAALVRRIGVDRLTIGDRGVKWGLAAELLEARHSLSH